MKNKLIKLGSILTFGTPIITVVSCGVNEAEEWQIKALKNLESSDIVDKVEEDWWNFVIKNENIQNFDKNNLLDSNEIKKNFDYLIQNKIYKNPSYLYELSIEISEHNKFAEILKNEGDKEPEVKLNEWGFVKELSKKLSINIENVINENIGLKLKAKKFIVNNLKKFRKELYKFTIARRYLSNTLDKDDYKELFMEKNDSFTDIQELFMNSEEFHLLNEAINQKLFIKWNIELNEYDSTDYFGLKSNTEKNYDEVKDWISVKPNGTKGDLLRKQPLLNLDKKILLKNIVHRDEYDIYKFFGGYKGIEKQDKIGNGILSFEADKFKKVIDKRLWEGFIFDDKFLNNKANNRNNEKMTVIPKKSKKVDVKFIKGLMPIYKDGELTFENSDFNTDEKKSYLISALSLNKIVYEDAVKFYTKRKTSPILLTLKEPLKKIMIDKGFKFIKE